MGSKVLREFGRKFNNACALAYEEVLEPDLEAGSGWQPSVVIQGKMYHRIGPLTEEAGKKKAFAQLYVHDPAAADDIAATRRDYMFLPKGTSKKKRALALELLRELQAELSSCNTYVRDLVSAGEIFRSEDVPERQFVIDADKRPEHAHERTYNEHTFTEVSVLMLDAFGGKAPRRCVKVRDRE